MCYHTKMTFYKWIISLCIWAVKVCGGDAERKGDDHNHVKEEGGKEEEEQEEEKEEEKVNGSRQNSGRYNSSVQGWVGNRIDRIRKWIIISDITDVLPIHM